MKIKLSQEQKTDGLIIAGWIVFVFAYFLPKLISRTELPHSTVWYGEATQQAIPFWKFSTGMLKAGLMPLWSPHFFCGYPFSSFPWNNIYYLPYYLVYRLPYLTSVYVESICCFILAGYFSYFCFRRMRLRPSASLAGMLTIVTGGYFIHYSTFWYCYREWYFALTCWGLAGLIYNRPRFKYFLALVLGAGLCMTMDVEKAFYLVWFYLGWVLWSAPSGERLKKFFLASIGLGLGFALVGSAPAINIAGFFSQSIRSEGITFSGYLQNQLPWQFLLLTFFPGELSFLNPFFQFYIGASASILAVFGIKRLGKKAVGSIIALLLYVLFTVGEPHFMKIFFQLPVFNRTILHYGAALIIFMIFSGWAAIGMEELASKPGSRRLMLLVSLLVLAVSALEIFSMRSGRVNNLLLTGSSLSGSWLKALTAHWFRPLFLFLLFSAGLVLGIRRKMVSEKSISLFMICFIIFDLSFFALSTRPSSPKELFEPGPALKSILQENNFDRFWPVTSKALEDTELVTLMGMQMEPLAIGTHTPLGYMRLLPRRVTDIIDLITPGYTRYDQAGKLERLELTRPLQLKKIDGGTAKIFSLLNVGIIISRGISIETDWPAREKEGFIIYKNPSNLARAFLADNIIRAKSGPDELSMLASPKIDLSGTVIVNEEFPFKIEPGPSGKISFSKFKPGYWEFEADVPGPGPNVFFLSENYYPGWKAFLDGVEQHIYRVDYSFLGVTIPPGRHHLKLQFEPASFHIGLWAGVSSYLSLFAFVLIHCLRKGRK